MADDRELLSALVSGLRGLGVPTPERCWLRTRWDGVDLVVQVHWPDFAIPTKKANPHPYTDHVLGAAKLKPMTEVATWVRETVAQDALALLRAELRRTAVRYPAYASKMRWPSGWPDPPTRHLIWARDGLPVGGINP